MILRFLFFIEGEGTGILLVDDCSPPYDLSDFSSKLLRDFTSECVALKGEVMFFKVFVVLGLTDKKFLSIFVYSFYISYVAYFFSSGSLS